MVVAASVVIRSASSGVAVFCCVLVQQRRSGRGVPSASHQLSDGGTGLGHEREAGVAEVVEVGVGEASPTTCCSPGCFDMVCAEPGPCPGAGTAALTGARLW